MTQVRQVGMCLILSYKSLFLFQALGEAAAYVRNGTGHRHLPYLTVAWPLQTTQADLTETSALRLAALI